MIEPHAHLAFEPQDKVLRYAMFWFAQDPDIFGWFIGTPARQRPGARPTPQNLAHAARQLASYFMLQDYHSARDTRFFRSVQDDVYGDWVLVSESGDLPVPHSPPLPEALCHELPRLQSEFIQHWLFFDMLDEASTAGGEIGNGGGDDTRGGGVGKGEARCKLMTPAERALRDREVGALRALQLPVRHINIRAARFGKLDTSGPLWRHDSPGADTNVLDYLAERWPLDYPGAT